MLAMECEGVADASTDTGTDAWYAPSFPNLAATGPVLAGNPVMLTVTVPTKGSTDCTMTSIADGSPATSHSELGEADTPTRGLGGAPPSGPSQSQTKCPPLQKQVAHSPCAI